MAACHPRQRPEQGLPRLRREDGRGRRRRRPERRPGEIVAFLGPNGAGKTTTVDMLLGLTSPTAGTVEVYGEAPGRAVAAGRVSAVCRPAAYSATSRCSRRCRRSPPCTVAGTGSPTPSSGPGSARSPAGGCRPLRREQQRQVRAGARPRPGPDRARRAHDRDGRRPRQAFWETMRADAAGGRTIVFATHYLAEADEFAARTVLMKGGRIVGTARPPTCGRLRRPDGHLPPAGRRRPPRRPRPGLAGRGRPALAPLASPTSTSPARASRPPSSPSPTDELEGASA